MYSDGVVMSRCVIAVPPTYSARCLSNVHVTSLRLSGDQSIRLLKKNRVSNLKEDPD